MKSKNLKRLISAPAPWCTKYSKDSVDLLEEETFLDSSLYLKLTEIPHSQYMIAPVYFYNLLSFGNLEIDDILSKLAIEEIIQENPSKHWEKINYYVN